MKKLHFETFINAPVDKVWKTMLEAPTYKEWTAAFNPNPSSEGSYFEGNWDQGSEIRFIGLNENGKAEGMIGRIAENRPSELISISYFGIIEDGVEYTSGEKIKEWEGATESYTFNSKDGGTEVKVDVDVTDSFEDYMSEAWPKALQKLKEMVETT